MNREPAGAAASCAERQPGPRLGSRGNQGKSWENSDACPNTPSLGKQCGGEAPSQGLQAGVLPALSALNSAGQPFHPHALLAAARSRGNQCYRSCIMQKSMLLFVTKLLFCRSSHAKQRNHLPCVGMMLSGATSAPRCSRPQDSKLHLCPISALPSLRGDATAFPVPTTSLLRCSHQTLIYRAFQNSTHAIASHVKHKEPVCL